MASVIHITIVESAGSQGNGGEASGPLSKHVLAGAQDTVLITKVTSSVTATAAHIGSWWRVAIVGDKGTYGECAVAATFTNQANAPVTAKLFPPNIVEYHRVTVAGEKWSFIEMA